MNFTIQGCIEGDMSMHLAIDKLDQNREVWTVSTKDGFAIQQVRKALTYFGALRHWIFKRDMFSRQFGEWRQCIDFDSENSAEQFHDWIIKSDYPVTCFKGTRAEFEDAVREATHNED